MLSSSLKILLISIIYLFAVSTRVGAQGISGPDIVNVNATERYEVDIYGYSSVGWSISGGPSIVGEAPDKSWIDVKFDIPGPFHISALLFDGNTNHEYILNGEVVTPFTPGSIIAATPLIDVGWQTLAVNNVTGFSGGSSCPFGQYSYEWEISYDNQTWAEIPGSVGKSAEWQITGYIDRTTYVRRKVILCHGTYYSNVVSFSVMKISGGRISASQIVTSGSVPQALNNEVLPTGAPAGSYSYQWESSADGVNWQVITGATGTGYQPDMVQNTTYYRRKVTAGTQFRYSNKIKVIVKGDVLTNVPFNATASPTQTLITIPSYTGLSAMDFNKVDHYGVEKPGILTQAQLDAQAIGDQVKKSTNYLDGLGRNIQTVSVKASLSAKDIVAVNVYDEFGREMIKHLPYSAATTAQNSGSFRTDVNTQQPLFLKQLLGSDKDYFYNRLQHEDGGLSRWAIRQQSGKNFTGRNIGSIQETRFNTENDKIRIWEIGDDPSALPLSPGYYESGALTVTEVTSEQGDVTQIFTNNGGDMVCQRILPTLTASDGEGLTTYFVYNDLRQNRFEIPPLAVKYCLQENVWNLNQHEESRAIAKDLCYRSVYNERGELIGSQKPGSQFEEEYIYDIRGRLVFMRNAHLRSRNLGEWLLFFYDDLDRPVITALYTNVSATYSSLLALVNQSTTNSQVMVSLPAPKDLYVESSDSYLPKYEASNSITLLPGFEWEAGAEIEFVITPGMVPLTETFAVSNPVPGVLQYKVLALYYYDDYNWPGARKFSTGFQLDAGTNSYPQAVAERKDARGFITGIKTAVLGQERMLTSVFFYDERGNSVQSQKENIAGGVDIKTRQYDFSGKILSSYLRHQNPESISTPEVRLRTAYEYDPAGRILSTRQTIFKSGGDITKELASLAYDETGRVISSTLGTLETLHYTYTPHGELEGINAEYARNGSGNHYFGMELKYDLGFASPRRDGLLSGVTWRRKGNPDEWHAFGYQYDGAARLTKADYSQYGGGIWTNASADFDVKIPAYDENGNILQMSRNGMLLGNVKAELDNLAYEYDKNGYSNKLLKVTDSKGNQQQGDFKDVNDTQNDYFYDDEGNLSRDRNRGITITNDFLLNKPLRISMDANAAKSVEYVYSFDGTKLKQIVKSEGTTSTYTYIGGFVYKNNELQLFPHDAGRVRRNANGEFVFDYFIPDQLGNIRAVITEESNIAYYKATHEDNPQPAPAIPEREAFNFPQQVDIIPSGNKFYDYNGTTNRKFIKLNSAVEGRKIGTSKVLRVMAGDLVETGVYSYYQQNSPANNVASDPASTILSQLVNVLLGPATTVINNGHGNLLQSNSNQSILNTADITDFITDNQQLNPPSQVPKAYLNYVVFDDNFKMVSGGALRVSSPDAVVPLAAQINVQKNGYIYIYVSNESPTDVYFDDLAVKHTTGHLLQEDTYYPFGLGIRALSSKALNRLENKYLFNGIEQLTEFDLEIYDAVHRNLDPQIGRWWQRDPKQDKYLSQSPYSLSGNSPVNFSDPLGDDYFRSLNGLNVIWRDVHDAFIQVNGEYFENIGPIVGQDYGGLFHMYINNQLAYVGYDKPNHWVQAGPVLAPLTEYATPYYKGQQYFVTWLRDQVQTGAVDMVRNELFHYKLSIQANYDRGILGGTPEAIKEKFRIKTNLEMIPTLREAYLQMNDPGIDLLGYKRNLTMLTNEEVSDVAVGTAAALVPLWIGNLVALPSVWATRPAFSLTSVAQVETISEIEIGSAVNSGTEGGLNLFKFGAEETTTSVGWKKGDRMLKMFDQGSPKLNWKQNSSFLRREMRAGNPIFDSYRLPNGNYIPTKGFLNAERSLLQSRGWIYNPNKGAWLPPIQ